MIQTHAPAAWGYHMETMRWPHNLLETPADGPSTSAFKESPDFRCIPLPPPLSPAMPFEQLVRERCSCRRMSSVPLGLAQLGTLLKFAYGVQDRRWIGDFELLERPVPSAGGLYPLELYVLVRSVETLRAGACHYLPLSHELELVREIEWSTLFVSDLFLGQPYIGNAAAVIVITAVWGRTLWKYGDRGYRYVLFEAGHVAQNISLCAAALQLGGLCIGGFYDADLAALLSVDPDDETPLYALAIGMPDTLDRSLMRLPECQPSFDTGSA